MSEAAVVDHEPELILIEAEPINPNTPHPHHGRIVGVVHGAHEVTIPPTLMHNGHSKFVRTTNKNCDGLPIFRSETAL